jgi:hypothetical protein
MSPAASGFETPIRGGVRGEDGSALDQEREGEHGDVPKREHDLPRDAKGTREKRPAPLIETTEALNCRISDDRASIIPDRHFVRTSRFRAGFRNGIAGAVGAATSWRISATWQSRVMAL